MDVATAAAINGLFLQSLQIQFSSFSQQSALEFWVLLKTLMTRRSQLSLKWALLIKLHAFMVQICFNQSILHNEGRLYNFKHPLLRAYNHLGHQQKLAEKLWGYKIFLLVRSIFFSGAVL